MRLDSIHRDGLRPACDEDLEDFLGSTEDLVGNAPPLRIYTNSAVKKLAGSEAAA
jgi:hypothetical protein